MGKGWLDAHPPFFFFFFFFLIFRSKLNSRVLTCSNSLEPPFIPYLQHWAAILFQQLDSVLLYYAVSHGSHKRVCWRVHPESSYEISFRWNNVVMEDKDKQLEDDKIKSVLSRCGYPNWAFKQVKDQIKKKDNNKKSEGYVAMPYVEGLSEPAARIFWKHDIPTVMSPHTTLWKLLVHPKDKRDPLSRVFFTSKSARFYAFRNKTTPTALPSMLACTKICKCTRSDYRTFLLVRLFTKSEKFPLKSIKGG